MGEESHSHSGHNQVIQIPVVCIRGRERKGFSYGFTRDIVESQTTGTDKAQSREKHPTGDERGQTLYAGLAELLRNSILEENNGRMKWVAAEKILSVHLETVEAAENKALRSA